MKNLIDVIVWKYKGSQFSCGETYDTFRWLEETPKPTLEDVEAAAIEYDIYKRNTAYKEKREMEYPSIVDQLDILYHQGYDGWRAVIKQVKDNNPKPNGE